jgi:MTH538 TIR-like domain (DUF1863)
MARRVFFSFHHDNDIFRANQVRNSNVVIGADVAGFFDHSEYEDAKKKGQAAIQKMIDRHLDGTSVTVVLIGTNTAERPWVKYEIQQSIARNNGLLGIQIHHLTDHYGRPSYAGPTPVVPANVPFPVYAWDRDVARFSREIEAAGKRADAARSAKSYGG